MTVEKKLEFNNKSKLRMMITRINNRQAMSPEETAKLNEKDSHQKKMYRQAMSPEEKVKSNEKATHGMKMYRQAMSPEEKVKSNEKATHGMKRYRQAMSPEEQVKSREMEKIARKMKRHGMLKVKKDDAHCIKEAKKYLHRTQHSLDPHKHKSIVCIICDRFIIGTETIHYLSKNNIIGHKRRLSVESYEVYYNTKLKPEVRSQYMINDGDLKHLLLSPRSRNSSKGYTTCSCCFGGMQPNMTNKQSPPKFAIANGFVIGSFPQELKLRTSNGNTEKRIIEEHQITDLLKAMMAPVRPYGSIFAYTGGAQKSIRGNYQFFEMDQNRIGGVIHQLNRSGFGEHIYCVLCGRMTPDQKRIVRERSKVDTQLFIDIMTWFVEQSGHPGFSNTAIPKKCPQPVFIEDKESSNNTDYPYDKAVESMYEGGTYYFSTAQDPSESTSVYGSSERFALAMFQRSAPTLLAYGGNYANVNDVPIENILPFAFPFGIGGPKMKRRTQVSLELCIQLYLRLSLKQFMEGPTILVLNHIYNRQMSYVSGVMTCRSIVNGVSLGDRLSRLTTEDLQMVTNKNTEHLNENTKGLLKAICTSCKAMGHTDEAAKYARRCCFAMLDHYGLNSLFLTTTPDDECSFRVRLYAKPEEWVSTVSPPIHFVWISMQIFKILKNLHGDPKLFHIIYFEQQCKLFTT